ncbi:MAG: tetratricopeptide repeat protein [Bryobacteraceae bacterium]|jgi:tetratricopeptide (TPR) repeat protein
MRIALVLFLCAAARATNPNAVNEANTGLSFAHDGKYGEAIKHYRAAIAIDPRLPGIQLNLGLAYFKLNRLPEAATAFEQAIKSDPTSFQARVLLGMSYYGCRRFDAAATELKRAAGEQPGNTELRFKLAQSYLWSNQYDQAKDEFRFLLTKDPESAQVHMLLGQVYDAANQQDSATTEFEAAVKAAPREPEVHFGLGYLYWKQKKYEDAKKEFLAELANQPQHTQALTYLGDAELNTSGNAREHLETALKLDPNLRLARLDLGIILAEDNNPEAALQLQEAIRLDPSKPDAHYRLGRLWKSMGREKDAAAEFAKVKDLAQNEHQDPLIKVRPGEPAP